MSKQPPQLPKLSRRRWVCPTCGRSFDIPASAANPVECIFCQKARGSGQAPAPVQVQQVIAIQSLTINQALPPTVSCPECKSPDCQRVEVALAAGTTHSSSIGHSIAGGKIGSAWAGGIGLTVGSGVSQTQLAAQLSPPKRQNVNSLGEMVGYFMMFAGLMSVCLACPTLIYAATRSDDPTSLYVMSAVCGAGGLAIALCGLSVVRSESARMRATRNWNETEWPLLYDSWTRKYICLRCGRIWIPPHLSPSKVNPGVSRRIEDRRL